MFTENVQIHVTCQVMTDNKPTGWFVIKHFNSECGVFQTTLDLPVIVWMKLIRENDIKITQLFQQSQSWKDTVQTMCKLFSD